VSPTTTSELSVPSRTRRVVVKADAIELEEADLPELAVDEALVQMVVTGVCGSDTHATRGRHPFLPLPYHPGHEVVGIVRSLGADVRNLDVGDRVTVEPTLSCRQCKQCLAGRTNQCEKLQFFGCGWPQGGMADYFTIRANQLHLVPSGFTDEQAALIEPLATPVHAVNLVGGVDGKTVVILGSGVIGLLLVSLTKACGAKRVIVSDPLTAKRKLAVQFGADAAMDATRPDLVAAITVELAESADVVFDCVAVQQTLDQAVALATRAGTVTVVGVPTGPLNIQLPAVQDQQLRIQGCATYVAQDFDQATRLIAEGTIPVGDIVTATVDLEDAATAFALSASGEHLKVLVRATAPHP
jgi:2-desacetyl-2-hydroxyethyl bacteriochlorophyllide A dehydrogenase